MLNELPTEAWIALLTVTLAVAGYLYKRHDDKMDKFIDKVTDTLEALMLRDAIQDHQIRSHEERIKELTEKITQMHIVKYPKR